jgi:hypothetical protein
MRRAWGCAAAVVALLALPATAPAADATSAEVRALAGEARSDAGALRRLRAIDRVDGRPVDLGRALDTTEREALDARLEALAAAAPAEGGAPAARSEAERVLDQRKYKGSSVPRPLRSPLQRLGEWLEDAFGWFEARAPGGEFGAWSILAAIALLAGALLARRVVRRHVEEEHATATAARRAGEDPRALERQADEADRAGDHTTAVRLRFRAGLLHLDARGAIELRPGLTTGQIARHLRSDAFAGIAATFDEIAYGGREATREDAATAKSGWKTVLAETRRDRRREPEKAAA